MKTLFIRPSLLAMAVVFGLAAFPAMAQDANAVLATVDGKELRASDLAAFRAGLPPQLAQQLPEDVLLDQLISNILIAKQAKAEGLDKSPAVKQSLATAENQILAKAWVNGKLKAAVTDAAVKAKYEELKTSFKPSEEVHARHILVKTEAEAKDLVATLKKGEDFGKLAAQKSIDPTAKENGGDLGYFAEGDMVPEFGAAVFAAKPNSLIETPIQTPFGWHVIKVEDRRMSNLPSFKEVQQDIKAMLAEEAIDKQVKELMAKAKITYSRAKGAAAPKAAPKPAQ